MAAGTAEKPKTSGPTQSVGDLRKAKAEREAAEKAKAAKPSTNGRAAIDAAHKALGTGPGVVPGVPGAAQSGEDGHKGSDIHDGDELEGAGTTLPDTERAMSLGFDVGGKKPTSAGLRLVGGKLDIDRSFKKGEKIVLRIEAEVGELAFVDQRDGKTGQVIGCERRHKARIVGVSVEG